MKGKKVTPKSSHSESGAILPIVIILALALTITGLAFLNAGVMENSLVRREIHKNQAFYLAEAGIERLAVKLYAGEHRSIKELEEVSGGVNGNYRPAITPTTLGDGQYWVEYYKGDPGADPPVLPYAISIGQVIKGGQEIVKKIKVELPFLAEPYEHALYAASSYSPDWTLELRGIGEPSRQGNFEYGGKDTTEGDIYANADVNLYEETSVYAPPDPNTYELLGEVNSTQNIIKHPSEPDFAGNAPYTNENVEPILSPDLRGMNYAENNTHDVGAIFDAENVPSGHLPYDHPLYDVVMKNPSDRSSECSSTTGDDYFFEPASIWGAGTPYTGETPLDLGDDRIYYVDGDVWFHSYPTYGFKVSGKALIVATGDIHISDNIEYADDESLLALVALGNYDGDGNLISGGNIYFGDPEFGTTYTVSAFMFAGNNFLYNVNSTNPDDYQRPETGFNIFGNWVAINEVSIIRDWYDGGQMETRWNPRRHRWETVWVEDWNPAYFDLDAGEWKDIEDEHILTEEELGRRRHYQMKVTYDERIRDPETQPVGLPQGYGSGSIFAGFTDWEEIE